MLKDLSSQFYSIILGGLLLLSIYHLLFYSQNKKKIYLFYGLYAFSLCIFLLERLPKDPFNLKLINPAIQFIIFAFYILFAKHLLDSAKKSKKLDNIFIHSKNLMFLVAFLFLAIHIVFGTKFQLKVYFYVIPFFIILCLYIYSLIFKQKGTFVRLFIIGSGFYFILTVVSFIFTPLSGNIAHSILYKNGIHPLFPMYIGILIENLIFAIIIGKKAQLVENENDEIKQELIQVKQLVSENHIILKNKSKIYLSELIYIKSEDHYLELYTSNKKEFIRGKINEIIEQLPPNFKLSHRSFIVNTNYIKTILNNSIILNDNTEIPLSRYKKKDF